MTLAIVTDEGTLICYLPGETPAVGDTLWINDRLYQTDTIVRPIAIQEDFRAYSSAMNLAIVSDITEESGVLLNMLNKLRRST